MPVLLQSSPPTAPAPPATAPFTGVSYGDTKGKKSKAKVLADAATIANSLAAYPAFCGVNLHSYEGWKALPA